MKKLTLLMLVTCIGLIVGVTFAQDDQGNPNDPFVNERANACFEDGSWDGKCYTTDADEDGDIDQQDVDWMWWCGWYVIRIEKGILQEGQYPAGCYTEPVVVPAPAPAPVTPACDPKGVASGPVGVLAAYDPCMPYIPPTPTPFPPFPFDPTPPMPTPPPFIPCPHDPTIPDSDPMCWV